MNIGDRAEEIKNEQSYFLGISPIKMMYGASLISIMISLGVLFWGISKNKETGQIGDTIGGIASPIINLAGAILVFYSFNEQLRANRIQIVAMDKQKAESHDLQLYQLIIQELNDIETSFQNFKYKEYTGKSAFNILINQFEKYHQNSRNIFPEPEDTNTLSRIIVKMRFVIKQKGKLKDKQSVYADIINDKLKNISKNYIPYSLENIKLGSDFSNASHYDLNMFDILYVYREIDKLENSQPSKNNI